MNGDFELSKGSACVRACAREREKACTRLTQQPKKQSVGSSMPPCDRCEK